MTNPPGAPRKVRARLPDAADLLLATLRLGASPACGELGQAWRGVSPDGLAHLVAFEGCSLWLHRRLHELRVLNDLDPPFAAWLGRRARQVVAGNLLVDAQRDALVQLLNELAVPHVVLKGAARRLVADRYPYADARVTGDVDVLLPGALARSTWERLRRRGFELATDRPQRYDAHFHLPPLKNGQGVLVELHTSTSHAVSPAQAWSRLSGTARVVQGAGGATQVPAATELFWHALTHAPLRWPHAFRLRFLQDAAVVWAAENDIDWGEIGGRLGSGEIRHLPSAAAWLGAAAWLAGSPEIDRRLGIVAAFDLPHALRWRLSVFRQFAPAEGPAGAVRHAVPAPRLCRILIAEGTRATLGLGLTPSPPAATPLHRFARSAVAGAARLCYHAWSLFGQPRSAGHATILLPAAAR